VGDAAPRVYVKAPPKESVTNHRYIKSVSFGPTCLRQIALAHERTYLQPPRGSRAERAAAKAPPPPPTDKHVTHYKVHSGHLLSQEHMVPSSTRDYHTTSIIHYTT